MTRKIAWYAASLLLPLAFALQPVPALAQGEPDAPSQQDVAAAKQKAGDGLTAYRANEFEKALALFQQAKVVYPSAQVLRLEGYCHLALEHWLEAAVSMDAALESQLGPLPPEDRKDVEQQLEKAMLHVGMLSISSTVPGAKLSVDGQEPTVLPMNKPLKLLIGKHKVTVSAPDHDDISEEVTIEPKATVEKTLDPTVKKKEEVKEAPPPPPPPPPARKAWFPMQREISYAAAGTGVLLGGVALTTGLVSAHLRGNVENDVTIHKQNYGENCDKNDYRQCVHDRAIINNTADQADSFRNATIGLGIAAGVLTAAGVVFFIFSGEHKTESAPKSTAIVKSLSCGGSPLGRSFNCSGTF